MASRKPLVMSSAGRPQQLQAGDTLDTSSGGVTLGNFPFQARLSLAAGDPIGQGTDQSTLRLNPFNGNRLALYNSSTTFWDEYALTGELTVAVPSTQFRMFDIFAFYSGVVLDLETADWTQASGSITGATNATPIVLTLPMGHGLVDGDLIGIAGLVGNTSLNGHIWQCTATTATTTTLFGSAGNGAYVSGGTWFKVNGQSNSGITTQDGVAVKSGDATRRYIGIGMTTGVSGQCSCNGSRGWLQNKYNQIDHVLTYFDATSHTYASTTNRPWNANGLAQLSYLVPYGDTIVELGNCSPLVSGGGGTAFPAVGFGNQNINVLNRYVAGTGSTVAQRYGVPGMTAYTEGLSWSGIVEGNLAAGTGTYTQVVAQIRTRR